MHLVPALISVPITVFHATALASLADVYGPSIDMHLDRIMPWYLEGIANTTDMDLRESLSTAAISFMLGLHPDAAHSLVQCLCSSMDQRRRDASLSLMLTCTKLLGSFCAGTQSDYAAELETILGSLLALLTSRESSLREAALDALVQVTQSSNKDELVGHLEFVRQAVQRLARESGRRMKSDQITIAGLCHGSGISSLLTIYQHGLLTGPPDQRQQAAQGIGELVSVTTPDVLKPFVIKITGPLIRIVGDRFPAPVKAAILTTLGLLLDRAAPFMKPFVPQLQATFTKNLRDSNVAVRSAAAPALASLLILAPRKVDSLLVEMIESINGEEEEEGIVCSLVKTIAALLTTVGSAISPPL